MDKHSFELRSYKPFHSPDGGGFNATLFVDGKRAAAVFDGGFGGGPILNFFDTSPDLNALCRQADAAIFERAHAGEDNILPDEWLVGELVERAEIVRNAKRGIVIKTSGEFGCLVTLRPHKPTTLADLQSDKIWRAKAEAEHGGKIVDPADYSGPLVLVL
jgi:hypothetical protein